MSNDLISREYLKDAINQFFVKEKYYHPYSKGRKTIPTEEVLDIIDNAPAIEPPSKCIAQVNLDDDKLKEYVNELAERIKKGEFLLYDSISGDDSIESENKEE